MRERGEKMCPAEAQRRGGGLAVEDRINRITGDVLDAAIKLFGPGLFESVYERILAIELEHRGHDVKRQRDVSFMYEGVVFRDAFRIDMLVDEEVVIELKSVAAMHPVFPKQLRTYLVLTGKRIGLLINFGLETLKSGFVRVINSHLPDVAVKGKNCLRLVTDLDLSASAPQREPFSPHSPLSASAPLRETFQPPTRNINS